MGGGPDKKLPVKRRISPLIKGVGEKQCNSKEHAMLKNKRPVLFWASLRQFKEMGILIQKLCGGIYFQCVVGGLSEWLRPTGAPKVNAAANGASE